MSIIGDFTVRAEDFALEAAFAAAPELTVEADRLASHSAMEVLPFLWVGGLGPERGREALEADPMVIEASLADVMDEESLFRVEWSAAFEEMIDDIVDHHAAILRAEAAEGTWSLRLRFAAEEMVSRFQSHFHEAGRGFEVHSLARPSEPRQSEFGITGDQREALTAAVESGYFAIPRETSAEELGKRLGISANAASERVRRGCETLVESTLLLGDEAD